MNLSRRSLIGGIIAAAVAPAIIRTPGLIMPIKPALVPAPEPSPLGELGNALGEIARNGGVPRQIFASETFYKALLAELGMDERVWKVNNLPLVREPNLPGRHVAIILG
jgi:hypothetical protein